MKKQLNKFYQRATRAYKNNSDSEHDRLYTMENAIERIGKLHTRIASDNEKQEVIGLIWIMYQTLQQRMVIQQSIYMDGMKREYNQMVCMLDLGETDIDNIERRELLMPATLYNATRIDVQHVDQLSESHTLFDTDPHYCLMPIADKGTLKLKRYGHPAHRWNVPTAFDIWKGIPYRIQAMH